ncbi:MULTISPECIES: SDR family NAD(P)-dependent oxidoreductase [Serratia]|uniref:SDR family NAD(P)-dependent oxidoreductase n=1 Tax=Serratia TaxID=613 RepID=UPI00044F6BC9|nr:SDR family NAD(P)-dependent oxidoreductase [Serratia marcescens]ETX40074.1 hypothetical protein P805_02879 [Serratia marcescens BIDMC 44]MBH1916158.1 SDR family NAD(P)-dependent oxidoreductase [Serratia marcescens]MBH2677037.1 SDR family NAD(P)-dependent oxidoreductase [Serratia marcescens]MBN3977679.1 SDR family NAD(P)-dependent oxidoreductase [Serratia marcescens]HEO9033596.1 SDR family NAD(P)-dependent oxidoreductase [Serratia marcescens]
MSKRSPLFKHKPLAWAKSEVKPATHIDTPMGKVPDPLYTTIWVEQALPEMGEVNIGPHLLLSRHTVPLNLPEGWIGMVAVGAEAVGAVLDEQAWQTVAVLSEGEEEDVAQALAVLQAKPVPRLVLLKRTGALGDAGLSGLVRTARQEQPERVLRYIECLPEQVALALSLCLREDIEEECRLTESGGMQSPRLQRYQTQKCDSAGIRADATYVISGGMGALGQVVAGYLAKQGAAHVLLLSRTAYSPADLPTLGENVAVASLACDVADRRQVEAIPAWLNAQGWPAISGVIHIAGLLTDGTLLKQTPSMLDNARAVKVNGAQHLHDILAPGDFMVLYSSAAAAFGSVGQASYAAANSGLDALAEQWAQAGEKALSIQWGAWSENGMAVRHDAVRRAESAGFGAISNTLGCEMLDKLLSSDSAGTFLVSPITWARVKLTSPLIEGLKPRPSAAPAEGVQDVRQMIREAVWETVGESVDDDVALLENGLDSLGSMSLRNRIASSLKMGLPATFALENPDINAMVRYVMAEQPAIGAALSNAQPERATPSLPVLVIGAGVGGLGFARQLEKNGLSVVVLEKNDWAGGVWKSLANDDSKLQIDSPAYDFDSNHLPLIGDHRWSKGFPGRAEILEGAETIAETLKGDVIFGCEVRQVEKKSENEYLVTYLKDGKSHSMLVSGVAAMTGGLHRPVQHRFPDEERFLGHVGQGISNDTAVTVFNGASVVIVGHGAFAIENMRTALENGAKHVTLLCRRRNLVLSTFCNWLLNANNGVMPVADVVEIMRPFYQACGIDIETLPSISRDKSGDLLLDQTTVPPGSDLFFLAQMLGKLTIVEDEVARMTDNGALTRKGQEIKADVFLKCLGSDTDTTLLPGIFGQDMAVKGLWINGDPNLFTYNDGAQVPRKVRTLLCSSYAFFVQAFARAYIHFRENPSAFTNSLSRIMTESQKTTNAERIFMELWDFIEPAKKTVAARTAELYPFDRFQVERENEWRNYAQLLGASEGEMTALWQLLEPAMSILHRRNPAMPVEKRYIHKRFGAMSVYVPRRRRVLFLSGQGTNARLAKSLLERTGWSARTDLEFVIPDAPYEMPAFTNEIQLQQIGLTQLVESGVYDTQGKYREWKAGFERLWEEFHGTAPQEISAQDRDIWRSTLTYVRELTQNYGPFEGIAGFCEGAAVASVALHLQHLGEDLGLKGIKFFIAMSPWRSPIHERDGLFNKVGGLQLPMLQIVGDNDMPVFLAEAPHFKRGYEGAMEYRHTGQHVYPPLTTALAQKLNQLIMQSEQ